MKKNLIQIAIDGPAGSGKTTVSKMLSDHYNIYYLSSGKIFRSYAYCLKDIDTKDPIVVKKALKKIKLVFDNGRFIVAGEDLTDKLTDNSLALPASNISAFPFTRKKYLKDIKKICKSNSIVVDGRDIGTIVMPKAPFKFYLDASAKVRAARRAKEIGVSTNEKNAKFKAILADILKRDHQDKTRASAPLVQAKDALYVDSTNFTAQQVVELMVQHIDAIRKAK